MLLKIIRLAIVLTSIWCLATLADEMDDDPYTGNAPFFELPCMIAGGTCARSVACPPGTKVSRKGLCPVQQDQGMECCRPLHLDVKCRSRGGECVTKNYKCPVAMKIKAATDCAKNEHCCALA